MINEAVATLKENICASCGYDCSSNMDICDISYCDNKEAIRIIEKVLHDVQLVGDYDCINRHDALDMIQNLTRWPIKEFGKYTKVGVIYNDAIHAVNSVIPVYKKFDGSDQQTCEDAVSRQAVEDTYNKGLNDAWECVRKITEDKSMAEWVTLSNFFGVNRNDFFEIFKKYSASEAIERMKKYNGVTDGYDDCL